jgi:DNA processing protein
MDSLLHQIALTLVPQVGAVTAKTLVSYCGSAQSVFQSSKKTLGKIPGIGPQTAQAVADSATALSKAETEIAFLEKHGVEAVFYTDARYPARLKQCADGPPILYFKGSDLGLLQGERMLAIVGTRQPSEHGKAICEEIVEGLAAYGAVVVSGLAFGIDVTAHRKACAIGLPNIGALGHGLGSIYPSHHQSVALRMIENGGLLTEYAHQVRPDREHFPMRNRIISGLSDAVLVVETAESGGSIITVNFAERYGREVFAVPGRTHDAKSIGCNRLIRAERACLAESAADIAEKLNWELPGAAPKGRQTQLFLDLSPADSALVKLIREKPEIPIDELSMAAQLPPGELASRILDLEFRGIVRTLPGKRYILTQ